MSVINAKTFALIIGVSNYKDNGIKDLHYADKDALEFYKYLTSEAGGNVDNNNIELLLNEQATVGNIYASKRLLELKVKKNDLVYFYFSGHGGVESDIYKSGFLLAYDSPINNFQNNAVEILHINKMANTFSAQTKANVILITDACRSGSLGGIDDVGKKLLLQDQLIEAKKREIRMASCLHDQLSLENKVWGGGRGLFSYELLNGLQGKADENKDLKVTLKELQKYLNSTMEEEVDKFLFDPQTPLFDGEEKTILSTVNPNFQLNNKPSVDSLGENEGNTKSVSVVISTNDHFFNLLEKNYFNGSKAYSQYIDEPINAFIDTIFSNHLYLNPNDENQSQLIKKFQAIAVEIKSDLEAHFAFKQKLAATIHNAVQKVINSYLSVDKEELERRQFYNSSGDVFRNYAAMIDLALNAVSVNSELSDILLMKKWYFLGLANRINVVSEGNADSMINEAIIYQERAEKINENAAYIQNELGILYEYNKDTTRAESKYLEAIKLVPDWALPYSNLSNLYYTMGKYDQGKDLAEKALELHPDLNLANFSLGRNSSKKGNYLLAKESYLKAIRSNPRHYVPYQYLGELYMQIAEYELADEYLRQAEFLKKEPLHMVTSPLHVGADEVVTRAGMSTEHTLSVPLLDSLPNGETDVLKLFYYGNLMSIKAPFEQIILLDDKNFMAYKAIGDFYFDLDQYMEAEYMYKLAIQFHLEKDSFLLLSSLLVDTTDDTSAKLMEYYRTQYFEKLELIESLGSMYRKWGFYDKAITMYKSIIADYPNNKSNYYNLWSTFEYLGNYIEAEKVIEAFRRIEQKQGDNELYAFYKRAIKKSDDPDYYNLAAGLLMFDVFKKEYPDQYYFNDSKEEIGIIDPSFADAISLGDFDFTIAEDFEEPLQLAILHLKDINTSHIYFENYQVAAKLGRLYGAFGDKKLTKEYFTLALNNPNSSLYANDYLNKLNALNLDLVNAYSNLKTLLNLSKLDYLNTKNLIEYAILAGDYEKADSAITKIKRIQLRPDKVTLKQEALNNYLSGNYEKSLTIFKALLTEDPNNPILAFTIFRIYAQNQMSKEADPYLGIALNNGIMKYGTLMRYDNYAFKGMYRFTKIASGVFGAVLTTKQ